MALSAALALTTGSHLAHAEGSAATSLPHLAPKGETSQLIVDGKPFLIVGGELYNSSASSLEHMAPIWGRLHALGANTVLLPVAWEQIEPRPGEFDFTLLDGLLRAAREHDLKIVILWFGSWKNSMSSYAPAWVKRDDARFPRIRLPDGRAEEILTPYSDANVAADAHAFTALMHRLAEVDGARHTVLMVQVENEMGVVPVVRDYSAPAEAAFHAQVPEALVAYLQKNRSTLDPGLRQAWESHGAKAQGDWTEMFGPGVQTEEYFAAWGLAAYAQKVAQAGKAAYSLPFYVNAALIRPGKRPGQYPSGGPLPHLLDIWKAATPSIDFISPDIYFSNFDEWADRYVRPGNPIFIPEATRAGWAQNPVNALTTYGGLHAIGFSPFAIDGLAPEKSDELRETYAIINALAPRLLDDPSKVASFSTPVSYDGVVNLAPQTLKLGRYELQIGFAGGPQPGSTVTAAPGAPDGLAAPPVEGRRPFGGMIIQLAADRFLMVGVGCEVTFRDPPGLHPHQVGIDANIEKLLVNGQLVDGRRLNGDDSNQGRSIRFEPGRLSIREVSLYGYD